MGCGSSSDTGTADNRNANNNANNTANNTTTTTTTTNTNTNTNTNGATGGGGTYVPDDNAIYGYDLYGDDNKKKNGGGGGGEGSNANKMQYDDGGYYGETDNEKNQQELFDGPGKQTDTDTKTTDNTKTEDTNVTDNTEEPIVTDNIKTEDTNVTDNKAEETNVTDDKAEDTNVTDDKAEETPVTENTTEETNVEEKNAEETNVTEETKLTDNKVDEPPITEGKEEEAAVGDATEEPPVPPPAPADNTDVSDGVVATVETTERASGDKMQFHDFRTRSYDHSLGDSRPHLGPGQVWTDHEFAIHHAITDSATHKKLKWKRPTELSDNPVLYSEGTTRFDIGQGGAGTCYFLSTVANISERPELLKKVIPDDAYPVGTGDYQGVFHARFWNFGKWVDVYIDDHLPVIYDVKPWGARSGTDENEFWVSLLEKAFARFHGSYNNIYGGQPGDAYMALTGGVAERIDFNDDAALPNRLFERVRNAVQSGALVTCTVPDKYDKVHGLVGGHAYSLTGAVTAKGTNLLRIRNPWGNTEWTGPWADGSAEWNGVSEREVPRAVIDDGEFWISLEDFLTYFSQTTICSLTPDFDMDGDSDPLEHMTNIHGEWLGKTAAGFKHKLSNPRYLFTVPKSESEAQVVVQLIQHKKERKEEGFQVRCDLFKVLGDNGESAVMEIMGENTNSYTPEIQCSYRHVVGPGTYAIVPSVVEAGMEKSFLIRLFSSCPVTGVRQMPASYKTMATEQQTSVEHDGKDYPLTSCQTLYGAWSKRAGNDGGQVSYRESHANNPQYVFTIDKPHTMIALHVMQEQSEPRRAVGFKLYPGGDAPMDIEAVYSKYDSAITDITGDDGKFVQGWDVDANYLLNPGQYTLLLHLNDPGEEKNFALVVKSSAPVSVMGHQTGM